MAEGILTMAVRHHFPKIFSLVLLVLYITGTSHLELLHSFAHDGKELVSHSDEQEKDPCHRLIFHNDTAQGCGHGWHLIVSDKCQMCDLACHGDQSPLSSITFQFFVLPQEQLAAYKTSLDSYAAVISSSRAPPALA